MSFSSQVPSGAAVQGAYVATAISSAGLPVTISSTTTAVCTIVPATGVVSFLTAGSCNLTATQAGTTNIFPANPVSITFTVFRGPQSVTFSSFLPFSTVNGPTYTVSASSTSGLPVSFFIDPSSSLICSIVGAVVSFTGSGDCRIAASQVGDLNFLPATTVQLVAVLPGAQTVSFTSNATASVEVGGPRYNVTGTSNRGLPVTVSVDRLSASVCRVVGNSVSFIGVGSCLVNLDQAGTVDYLAAATQTQTINVVMGRQSLVFVNPAPSQAFVGGLTYTALATASSELPVIIVTFPVSVCSVSGFSVSFHSNATCIVTATQPGNASLVKKKSEFFFLRIFFLRLFACAKYYNGDSSDPRPTRSCLQSSSIIWMYFAYRLQSNYVWTVSHEFFV